MLIDDHLNELHLASRSCPLATMKEGTAFVASPRLSLGLPFRSSPFFCPAFLASVLDPRGYSLLNHRFVDEL